jgi:hypothetical protein
MLAALAAILVSALITLAFLPLWPLGIWAFIDWHRTPPAPDAISA